MSDYIIRKGDTLSQIAARNNVSLNQLLDLNPEYRHNPDLIYPGQTIRLSQQSQTEVAVDDKKMGRSEKATEELPPAQCQGDNTNDQTTKKGSCQEKVVDLVHLTGEGDTFYALSPEALDELNAEIDFVENLMTEYRNIVSDSADTASQTLQGHDQVAEAKKAWLGKARDNGLMCTSEALNLMPPEDTAKTSAEDKAGLIAQLKKEREAVERFSPGLLDSNNWEDNCAKLRAARLKIIDQELALLNGTDPAAAKTAGDTKTNAQFMSKSYHLAEPKAQDQYATTMRASKTGFLIQEVTLLSKPDKFYYLRSGFLRKVAKQRWARGRLKLSVDFKKQLRADNKLSSEAMAKALIGDIKTGIKDDWDKSKLEKLEAKFWEWKAPDDCLFNTWHSELLNYDSSAGKNPGDTVMAVTAEAHALRFAAAASASVSGFNPKKLQMNMGAKFETAVSLVEGSLGANIYLPNDGGYNCIISYNNASSEEVLHEFGAFRLKGAVTLSCFAGARVSANGEVKLDASGLKKKEVSSGASALMSPSVHVESSPQQGVTLKGEAFAGVDAGGSVTGELEWESPRERKKWKQLVEVKTEGAVSFGIGASGSFHIRLARGKFELHVQAQLVFGPGAGGGFGTTVDVMNLAELFEVVLEVLAEVDYRYINIISEDAFKYMAMGLFRMTLGAGLEVFEEFKDGVDEFKRWMVKRKADEKEALSLARQINFGLKVFDLARLPPQTSGPILYTLAKNWAVIPNPMIEPQESAIVKVLKPISSWRQFIEILEHMSKDGEKVDSFASLEKLNSILDWGQQDQFNEWINKLQHRQPGDGKQFKGQAKPFDPVTGGLKVAIEKRNRIAISGQLMCWNGDDLSPPGGGMYA
ncbi:LysM peptidoglycan-binding domain-containing protein [Amphritea pacifica]|uniref:LysM peptidoglycan-binding domain-containing protein n=1 Tax=Amphritea pacifica TaxID=2811233 RepID=A0ABS2W5Y9_9GAMM|nr:LysM domain-containing protein [Amphritea pacifica]MBN0986922.1 LysM peptidoglycan-binding domain-containing protein [Amphritea pacifica]